VVLLVICLVTPQAWAWYHLRAAISASASYHPEEARKALLSCRDVWSGSSTVHLLISRAARQEGDLETADRELRICQRLSGGATNETAFEWALLQASAGNVREVDEYLQKQINRSPQVGPLVWEALVEGYLRIYRAPDAMACLNLWLKHKPDDVRALELRGRTYVIGNGVTRGTEDYRRVLVLDPSRKQTRWQLIECLMILGTYDEAVEHLELYARDQPDNPEVISRLARCYNVLNRKEEARQLLDHILAKYPDDGQCLRIRGQIALTDPRDPQAAEAEAWIRRASAVLADDYQTQWLLFEVFRRQGKAAEAKEQHQKAEAVKDRMERLGELRSRKLAEQPFDPALHYEMGILLIQTGHPDIGERWLYTALGLDPNHKPSHAALADYYDRIGDKARAEEHRRRANQ
jgi:predicted Zn-dependent protease